MSKTKPASSLLTDLATLEHILDISQSLADYQDLHTLLRQIVQTAGTILGADLVVLFEYDEANNHVNVPPVTWGTLFNSRALEASSYQSPYPGSAIFEMLQRPAPFYASDAIQDWPNLIGPRNLSASGNFIKREHIRSSAGVRLTAGDSRVGVLFVNYRRPHEFQDDDKKIIELLSIQAAVAIQNARLLERERRLHLQADTLRQVSLAIISTTDIKDVSGSILDALGKVIQYRKATMQLIRGNNRELAAYRGFGADEVDLWLLRPVSQDDLIAGIVESRKPLILGNVSSKTGWEVRAQTKNVRSWVGLPLVFQEQTIGLITLDHDEEGFYKPSDEELLTSFASQAASAVKNALLFEDTQRRLHDLELLTEIPEMVSDNVDTDKLLKTIVNLIANWLRCTHCAIYFPEQEHGHTVLKVKEAAGLDVAFIRKRKFKPGQGFAGWAFVHGESIISPDARQDPRYDQPKRQAGLPRSTIVVPIKFGKRPVGVITADQDEYAWFSESNLRFVEALARQAGIAIQRNLGLTLLQNIGDRINSAEDVKVIMEQIVSGAIELTHTTSGVIYLISDDGRSVLDRFKSPPDSFHPDPRMKLKNSSTRRVISTGKELVFTSIEKDPSVNPVLVGRVYSMIAIPLKHGPKVVGVLYLNDKNQHEFTKTEISLLKTMANQAATAIYKRRQIERHNALNTITAELSGTLDEDTILDLVAKSAAQTLDSTHCAVFRVEGGNLVLKAVHGQWTRGLKKEQAFALGRGVAGWVAQQGKPALVNKTWLDERFDKTWSSPPPKSLVDVPIFLENRVYGVISAEHRRPNAFDTQDLQLLQTLALQVGQAVRSARRFHDLEVINQTGRLISEQLDINRFLETLLETVKKTLKSYTTIMFKMEENGELSVAARSGPTSPEVMQLRFKVGDGLAGWVAQHKQSRNVPDTREDPDFIPFHAIFPEDQPRSMLLAPMLLQDRVLGVLCADKPGKDGFDESDQRLLETLANQAATTYENARLFQVSTQRANEVALLHDVSSRLMTLKLDDLLRSIVQGAMRLTNTEMGIINLLSEDGSRIIDFFAEGKSFEPEPRELSPGGLTKQIFDTGKPIFISDVRSNIHVSRQVRSRGFLSMIGQPLISGDKVLGVLYLNDYQERTFNESEQKLIATLAAQAAIAIENARHYERHQRDSNALRKTLEIVGTIGADLDPLPTVLQETVKLFDVADYGSFALVDTEEKQIITQVIWDKGQIFTGHNIPEKLRSRSWGKGIMGYVARTGMSYRTGNVNADPEYERVLPGTFSELVVPLKKSDGEIIGVLNLESPQPDAFDRAAESLCQDLANVAMIAIEKGELYKDLQRRVLYLDALNLVANQIGQSPKRSGIFYKTITRQAQTTLQATCTSLFLYKDNQTMVAQAVAGLDTGKTQLSLHSGEGQVGWAAQEERPMVITRPLFQDFPFSQLDWEEKEQVFSIAIAPLWVEGQVKGVMVAARPVEVPFDEADLRFVETMAIQAGIYIHQEDMRRRREQAYRQRFNPYITGSPIRKPEGFFGREQVINEILAAVHANHLIIYGEKRIGKTSLLYQVGYHLQIQAEDKNSKFYFLPVHLDLEAVPQEKFFTSLIQAILRALKVSPKGLIYKKDKIYYDQIDLEQDLETLVGILQKQHPDKEIRIIFLLDEMGRFISYESDIHEQFRSLLLTPVGDKVKVIMAGISVQLVHQITSPWYNVFKETELAPFDEPSARQLITEPVRGYYTYEPDGLNMLLQCSDLKPNEIQRLGSLAVDAMFKRMLKPTDELGAKKIPAEIIILQEDVQQAVARMLQEKSKEYSMIWKMLTPLQQHMLLSAAHGDGWIDDTAVPAHPDASFTQEELYNITHREGQRWKLTYLFQEWLRGVQL